ncbi:MAG: UDP-N-acetylmuramoyl-tripeptide--D-alanyl-D-alanine ligase [Thermoguttaceae bacterium]
MDTLHDLAQATGGRILPTNRIQDAAVTALGRIVTDSRQVESNDIFWALRGPNYDGACFLHDAFRRGAQGAVVSPLESIPTDGWILNVDDTQRALEQWARWKRRRFTGIVIAVTGSVGKTTTRQMIHTVLQSRLRGTASPRNLNNQWGVPLSMLTIEPQHDYAVLELGANRAGEIAMLAELCAPKVGVIMQLGDAHLGGFGNRQGVAEAKSELLAALPSSGHAVLADDSWLRALSSRCAAPITWIGTGPQCNLRAVDIECQQGRLEFHVACGEGTVPASGSHGSTKPVRFSIPVWGRHHISAALASVAVGRMMGFDLEQIASALANYQAVPMRCEVTEIRGATIINDTYNSNPTAMRAALELLRDFDAAGRRIVICGDMAELGAQSIAWHWQMGKDIVQIGGAELVIACGRFARHVTAGARSTGLDRARAVPCDTIEDAMPYVGQAVLPGDIVLVKGSRVMAMECLVEALKQYPQRKSA